MAWVDLSNTNEGRSATKATPKLHEVRRFIPERSREAQPTLQGYSLRQYQIDCLSKMKWALGLPGNNLVMIPQGGGKSIIIASFANTVKQDVLILVPSKELLTQNLSKMKQYVSDDEIGIYSASFNLKDVRKYTFSTIQSACKHPDLFTHFKIVLLDEANQLNPKNFDGMYNRFFREIGNPTVYGFTATPFRQDIYYEKTGYFLNSVTTTKMITRYRERVWDRFLYVINTRELVNQGYLSPLEYLNQELVPLEKVPTNKSQSDFDLDKYVEMVDQDEIIRVIEQAKSKYKSIIVFCPTIESAESYNMATTGGMVVSSTTPHKEREESVRLFKEGKKQIAFNVNIFTYGFDHPELDCIILVRPTRSLAMYCQMLGRGTRIAPGKTKCTVIDLTGTVRAMGKLDTIEVKKIANNLGNLQWNVISESMPTGFHMEAMFRYRLRKKDEEL